MAEDFEGASSEPRVAAADEGDETVVGELDLARTRSSEIPVFDPDLPPASSIPHAAILRSVPSIAIEPAVDDLGSTSAWRVARRDAREQMTGKIVAGRYRLGPVLGQGGMGTVYRAEHTDLGKRVAIKVLAADLDGDGEATARFLREAKAASTIESDHIAQVFDVGEDLHLGLYMVMELLKGEDLSRVLAARGPLPPLVAAGIASQVLLALERAHEAGVAHRDLKPANVFLTQGDDGSVKVKVLDFGIAKLLRDVRRARKGLGITQSGIAVGTPQYMSPEQAQGLETIDHRTDVYSVGALLFECITGVPPFEELEAPEMTLVQIVTQSAPRLASRAPGVPDALDALVAEAMAHDPAHRPSSARELRKRLAAIFPTLRRRTLSLNEGPASVSTSVRASVRPPIAAPVAVHPRTGSAVTVDSPVDAPAPRPRSVRPLVVTAAVLAMSIVAAVLLVLWPRAPAPREGGAGVVLNAAEVSNVLSAPVSAGPSPMPPATGAEVLAVAEAQAADLVQRAQSALERGNAETARDLAGDAVRRAPASAEAWLTLGAAREALGDRDGARAAYESCKAEGRGERVRECAALLER